MKKFIQKIKGFFVKPNVSRSKTLHVGNHRKKNGFKVWDVDNKEYLLGGTAFNHQNAAVGFANDWLKIHRKSYNEKSIFEIHN